MAPLVSSRSTTYEARRSGRLRHRNSLSLTFFDSDNDRPVQGRKNESQSSQEHRNNALIKECPRKAPTGPRLQPGNAFAMNSPVRKMDVQEMFAQVIIAWPNLSPETQQRLLDALPEQVSAQLKGNGGQQREPMADGNESLPITCPISASFVKEDHVIRRDVARFKRDIADGNYRKRWQQDGQKAMKEREMGCFDTFIQEKAEKDFTPEELIITKTCGGPITLDGAQDSVTSNGLGVATSMTGEKGSEPTAQEEAMSDPMIQDTSTLEPPVSGSVE